MAYMNLTDETIRRLASAIGAEVGKVLARELAAILDEAPEVVQVPEKPGTSALAKKGRTK